MELSEIWLQVLLATVAASIPATIAWVANRRNNTASAEKTKVETHKTMGEIYSKIIDDLHDELNIQRAECDQELSRMHAENEAKLNRFKQDCDDRIARLERELSDVHHSVDTLKYR